MTCAHIIMLFAQYYRGHDQATVAMQSLSPLSPIILSSFFRFSSLYFSLLFSLSKYLYNLDDLSGPVATLPDLLNEVAPHTNKWEEIGLQLDLSHTDIERIKIEE